MFIRIKFNHITMEKERIYLTDITLHTRGYRPTGNFSKVAEKGRMYSSVPKDYIKKISTDKKTMSFSFDLPPDLKERLVKGEIELMVPKDGLLMYAGKDVWEFAEKIKNKQRNLLIHNGRVWHSE